MLRCDYCGIKDEQVICGVVGTLYHPGNPHQCITALKKEIRSLRLSRRLMVEAAFREGRKHKPFYEHEVDADWERSTAKKSLQSV